MTPEEIEAFEKQLAAIPDTYLYDTGGFEMMPILMVLLLFAVVMLVKIWA